MGITPFSKKDHLFFHSHILKNKNSFFYLVHKDMTTVASLKQSVIPWSYIYKPPDSNIQYDVQNTCSIDTNLQMIFFLWIRGLVPHSFVEKDSLLLETLYNVRKGNFAKARHNLLIGRSLPIKVKKEGKTESWNCWGGFMDYKSFPEYSSHMTKCN